MGEMRSAYTVLVGKAEGKRPSYRLRFRRKVIKMELKSGSVWSGFI
jgi:hypothetical protein